MTEEKKAKKSRKFEKVSLPQLEATVKVAELEEKQESVVLPEIVSKTKENSSDKMNTAKIKKSKKNKKNEAEVELNINKELEEIYRNGDGSMPDMKDFEKPSRSFARALLVLFFSCLFLGVVAWFVFFVFNNNSAFKESDVILEIVSESEIQAGSEVHYRLRYRNEQKISLTGVNLSVRYPQGFIFQESNLPASNEKNDNWEIGELAPGASGYLDIYGLFYGNLDEEQSLRVFLNYQPSNFSSQFQKVATFSTKINNSPIILSVAMPEQIVAGSETEFAITLTPVVATKNLSLIIEPEGNFTKLSSEPVLDEKDGYIWNINDLSEEKKFLVTGTFNPGGETVNIKFKLLAFIDENRDTEGYLWQEQEISLPVVQTELSAKLFINGTADDFSVVPGETLNTSLILQNSGETSVQNIQARLVFETPSFDNKSFLNWSALEDVADGDIVGEQLNPQTRRGIITWTKKHLSGLGNLSSGKSVNIDLSIPFRSGEDIDLSRFSTAIASAFLEVKYESEGEQKIISSPLIKMFVNSDLSITVRDEAIFSEGNKMIHNTSWVLTNSFHELKDLEISADFYGDITWLADKLQVPAGEANFDLENKKLVWKVPTMPVSVDVLALQFSLILNSRNPSQTNLASKVSVKATDLVTGQQIILAGEEILLP